ncbi:MAG: acyltransferase domain-containing protein, partial [bacterium]|nr:acyltransferase domain-containing protein [bacterium]
PPAAITREGTTVPAPHRHHLILLSARTTAALEKSAEKLETHFKNKPGIELADAAYTLQVGRKAFQYRKALVCRDTREAIAGLKPPATTKKQPPTSVENKNQIIFMFSGLGPQYVDMGRDLYREEPVFRQIIDDSLEKLKPVTSLEIKKRLYPDLKKPGKLPEHQDINSFEIAQPMMFILQYALTQLLIKWGIKPAAMIGYSFGEYVAACISGILTLEDALKLIHHRGQLVQKLPTGAMLSLPVTKEQLTPMMNPQLSIAVDNGTTCIVSGTAEAVEAIRKKLKQEQSLIGLPLESTHAIHSHMMEPVLEELTAQVAQLNPGKIEIPYISNVTGTWITNKEAQDPTYWSKHLRSTVRFADGLKELTKKEKAVFLEIGPAKTLITLATGIIETNNPHKFLNLIRHPNEKANDNRYLLNRIGRLWTYGTQIDWTAFYENDKRNRIPLPTYPFESRRYKIEGDPLRMAAGKYTEKPEIIKKAEIAEWFYERTWKRSMIHGVHGKMTERTCWLLLIDNYGLGARLAEQLQQAGQDVVTVSQGIEFTQKSEINYTVNPQINEHYFTLLKKLTETGKKTTRIIHLWNVTGGKQKEGESDRKWKNNVQEAGNYSLINLAQAIGKNNYTHDLRITAITDSMQEVTGGDNKHPEKAAILGPLLVIPQEYPNIFCQGIDIHIQGWGTERENREKKELSRQLMQEFAARLPDRIIAYRNNYRWVQTSNPLRYGEIGEKIPTLRKEGVYLVTGGLGQIGLELAGYLAEKYSARLVLTGRTALPARDRWEEWLKHHNQQDETAVKIKKIKKMEAAGARVIVKQADVANREQMQKVVDRAERQLGTINGV